jgi:hypothetical protein
MTDEKKSALQMSDEEFKEHQAEMIAQRTTPASNPMTFEKDPLLMNDVEWAYANRQMKRQHYRGLIRTPSQSELENFRKFGN